MGVFDKATAFVQGTVGRTRMFCTAHKPELLLGAGLIGIGAGVAFVVRGTLKARDDFDELIDQECIVCDRMHDTEALENEPGYQREVDLIHQEGLITPPEAGRELIRLRILYGLNTAKHFIPAAIFLCGGVACVIMAHNEQGRRLAMLTAAYNSMLATFTEYRNQVRADKGKEYELDILDKTVKARSELDGSKDSEGHAVSEDKALQALGIDPHGDCNTILFDENSSYKFNRQANIYNIHDLTLCEEWAKNRLHAMGYLVKAEVLENLGIDPAQYPMSFITGWVYDGTEGSDIVDFGLWDIQNEKNWSEEKPIGWWLHFNDHGVILPYLELVRRV